nr:thymidine phosphorylase [Maliibacterium massiliense]
MNMVDLIIKKRDGRALTTAEIQDFVRGVTDRSLPDYQVSAFLMAVVLQGMDIRETTDLTLAMAASGAQMDLSAVAGITADKHSTGGVGDTTTLVVAPTAAACGLKIAKMSGRGLGHTGGTVDKLEAIPGLRTELAPEQFIDITNRCGLCVMGQSARVTPADKELYALRDVTGTVESMPLIASSIMSKKLAAGAEVIVLDVKYGAGAFMHAKEDAFSLAQWMVNIGRGAGRRVRALVTGMDAPLGDAIGNALEVREAVEVLQGKHADSPLYQVCIALCAAMLQGGGLCENDEARARAKAAIAGGEALDRLRAMIQAQGGDASVCDAPDTLLSGVPVVPITAARDGYVAAIDAMALGLGAGRMGAGRMQKEDMIDAGAGLLLKKRVGDPVRAGETWCEAYVTRPNAFAREQEAIERAIAIADAPPAVPPRVQGSVDEQGVIRQVQER